MADIKVLIVADGSRFNFGPAQPSGNVPMLENDNYFGVSELIKALTDSTTPTIQVDRAHRRGLTNKGKNPDCSAGLSPQYADQDFVFALDHPPVPNTVTADLGQYDVLWLLGDEGYNGGSEEPGSHPIADIEKIAIATFMQNGGGVFAVGDHDGLGSYMCGELPRIRTMRKWFDSKQPQDLPPDNSQKFTPNWSATGLDPSNPQQTDRNDTLIADKGDNQYYFFDQSDQQPQQLYSKSGAKLDGGETPVNTLLRDSSGAVIAQFPDHMHEGEATDFMTVSSPPFNPNKGTTPFSITYTDENGHPVRFIEFPIAGGVVGGYQPEPEVIAYGSDTGHITYYNKVVTPPTYPMTQPKKLGVVSIYDGHAVGVGRIVTGSTFHHYLDKNLIGDPGTDPHLYSPPDTNGPSGTDSGLPLSVRTGIYDYYINTVTWLARLSKNFHFWTLKNTYGADEVADAAAHGKQFPNAFFLVLDGYTQSQVGGKPTVKFSGSFYDAVNDDPTTFAQDTVLPNDPGNPNPQRILIPYAVTKIPTSAFQGLGAGQSKVLPLEARIILADGTTLAAESLFELVAGADPYFSNLGTTKGEPFYLSQDLRVFQAGPNASSTPFVPFPANGSGYDYITQLLAYLNTPNPLGRPDYTTGANDPFQILNELNDLTEASSVTPNVHNFAVARVRLKGSSGQMATGVKVFFRLWISTSNDTDYDAQTTYPSTLDGSGLPERPLASPVGLNAPLYASNQSGSGDYDPGVNQRNITVGTGGETWAYFGCYLDVYGRPELKLIGTHHCLVAQIAYDGAPIAPATGLTLSPENSDKLSQRNIQITSL